MLELGKFEKVALRDVWPKEAQDFTKWLAKDENLKMLGDAVGIDLECDETESSVGSFNVDIYAHETGTDLPVIIENQLEDTNHDHLGKIITYAAGKDAKTIIWVVKRARDEHRQAIEWLNRHTDSDIAFFLVVIEVWKIGESKPAPRFSVVESPNEWARAEKSKEGLNDTERLRLEYWQRYREAAIDDPGYSKYGLRPRNPSANHWSDVSVGSKDYHLVNLISVQKKAVGVEICFSKNDNVRELAQPLLDSQKEIEGLIDAKAAPYDSTRTFGIRFYHSGFDAKKHPEKWDEFIAWQLDALVKLYEVMKKKGL